MMRRPPRSSPFPYPTLFRSRGALGGGTHPGRCGGAAGRHGGGRARPHPAAAQLHAAEGREPHERRDRKSTRLNSSHANISYAVFCLKKKKKQDLTNRN